MATTTIINDLIDLNQTGNTTALKGCVGTNANQPVVPTINVQYLVVGGGGGGGSNGTSSGDGLGGGGAGGFSTGTIAIPNNTAVNIVVGQGGLGGGQTSDQSGANGQDSGFYQIQGQGGGGGGEGTQAGFPGGSGGGGGRNSGNLTNTGTGVSGQGNSGGLGGYGSSYQISSGGGGGGASTVGATGGNTQSSAGAGGTGSDAVALGIITQANGITANIGEVNGATLNFSGGGGGGQASAGAANDGGLGGGGNGGTNSIGLVGTTNTGGGGGGDGSTTQGGGGTGGSGVVILRYANNVTETIAGSLAGGITTGTTGDCNYPVTATALYQLNSDGGTTNNVPDTCGAYNGTAANITYSAGKFGNAADFNGSNTSINIGASNNFASNKLTISFWANPGTGNASNYQMLFSNYIGGSVADYDFIIDRQVDQKLEVGIAGSGSAYLYVLTDSAAFTTGTWKNYVIVFDTTQSANLDKIKIYINGTLVAYSDVASSGTVTGSLLDTSDDLLIGDWPHDTTHIYSGLMDQVRIFPSALTADQVALLYDENVGATKFTESSDTVLVFKGGSGTINLTDTSLPGPKVGDLRTNTDQTSAYSASAMEHYMSTGWRVFDNYSTLGVCNYPTTATALYQFEDTPNATCGPNPTTTANLTYVAGKFGKAVDFNGTDSVWQSTNQIINSRSSFSISMWVKIDAYSSPDTGYLWTGYATGDWSINIGGTGSKYFRFAKYDNTQSPIYIEIADPSVAALGQWYHVCGTFSTTTGMVLYVDGTSVGSDNTTWAGQNHGAYSDSIGCYGYTPSGNRADFDGQIDQFRAFQSALTSTQVEELYNES